MKNNKGLNNVMRDGIEKHINKYEYFYILFTLFTCYFYFYFLCDGEDNSIILWVFKSIKDYISRFWSKCKERLIIDSIKVAKNTTICMRLLTEPTIVTYPRSNKIVRAEIAK